MKFKMAPDRADWQSKSSQLRTYTADVVGGFIHAYISGGIKMGADNTHQGSPIWYRNTFSGAIESMGLQTEFDTFVVMLNRNVSEMTVSTRIVGNPIKRDEILIVKKVWLK